MIVSSNGNIFRVTGPLYEEFTGDRWIPLTKASDGELWWFLWSVPWINGWVNNREAGDSRCHHTHYDVTEMDEVVMLIVQWINLLWLNDIIWWHRIGSAVAQVMVCCLMTPSHYLYQCWLICMESRMSISCWSWLMSQLICDNSCRHPCYWEFISGNLKIYRQVSNIRHTLVGN